MWFSRGVISFLLLCGLVGGYLFPFAMWFSMGFIFLLLLCGPVGGFIFLLLESAWCSLVEHCVRQNPSMC